MQNLNIVLVEPQIPQNTGNISRTCAVTGARLHLVRPLGFEVSDKHLKRAGLDDWDKLDITYYDSLADFFEKNKDGNFFYFTTKGLHVHSEAEYPDNAYLVFGLYIDIALFGQRGTQRNDFVAVALHYLGKLADMIKIIVNLNVTVVDISASAVFMTAVGI